MSQPGGDLDIGAIGGNTTRFFKIYMIWQKGNTATPFLEHLWFNSILSHFINKFQTDPWSGSLTWVAHWPAPADGQWSAFYVDLQFEGGMILHQAGLDLAYQGLMERAGRWERTASSSSPRNLYYHSYLAENNPKNSSSISIVPDTFPVEECFGEECMAGIVWSVIRWLGSSDFVSKDNNHGNHAVTGVVLFCLEK